MSKNSRRGFTLPEVLVTLAIVATLSAVLLPALNNQLSKGDAGRLTSDLVAVQTAVGAFTSDVRRYPSSLTDLKDQPLTADLDILGNAFGDVLIKKWRGPYLSKAFTTNMATGYGANITGAFEPNDYNAIKYLTIYVSPLTLAEFNNIDQIIDETANSNAGQMLFTGNAISGTARWFAVPIQ